MALRKFLYQDATDLYHVEQAAADELSLGKITLSGVGGIAIDAGAQRIANVLDPTGAQDAATKSYVDAASFGMDWKASVRVATTANITLSGAQTIDGVSVIAGDRVLVRAQTTASENGIYVAAAGAWARSSDADANVEVTAGLTTFASEGTLYGNTAWILTTDDPIVVGTTSLLFTQIAGPGTFIAGAGLTLTGNTFDVGDGPGILVNADSIEVELATNPALEFDAGGAAGKLRFKPDTSRGLNRDSAGAYIALSATPGLEFSAGLLQVLVDPNGGVERVAAGIKAKLNGTTLQSAAAGLSVKGLPSLFEINAIATGATVTAANLDTLTNGSNADALHVHAAANATGVTQSWTANGAVTKGDGVYISAANSVSTGDASNVTKSYVYGVADATVADTNPVNVKLSGIVTGVLSGATAGARYFMGTTGQPVLAGALPGGARTIQVGFAKTTTDLAVHIFDYGKKA